MINEPIQRFDGTDYAFLSNFYEQSFDHNGHTFKTSEHAYQAFKANTLKDFYYVAESSSPAISKKRGREIQMEPTFERDKVLIMRSILKSKFSDLTLKQQLLDTGDAHLLEGNTWHDNFWGDCTCQKCKNIIGLNKLGQSLMYVRDLLNEVYK